MRTVFQDSPPCKIVLQGHQNILTSHKPSMFFFFLTSNASSQCCQRILTQNDEITSRRHICRDPTPHCAEKGIFAIQELSQTSWTAEGVVSLCGLADCRTLSVLERKRFENTWRNQKIFLCTDQHSCFRQERVPTNSACQQSCCFVERLESW